MSSETCMIFVDDSNVWIEAQKFAASGNSHMPKLQDSARDPRLRIDIGKLVERLRKDRTQGPSFLFGSRPPPNDSVWKAFEKNKFETNIYDRAHGGKEKEVDNSMSVRMSVEATRLSLEANFGAELGDVKAVEEKDSTTFVVITGDRDMMPAVKEVLKCKIRVELWGWKSGISQSYLELVFANSLLSVHLLDSIFKDICFTAYRSTRKIKCVVGGKTMVLRDVEEGDEDSICDRLLNTRQLFWKTRWDGEADLCIEFPEVDQIEKIILQARQLLPDITIQSWPEYRARFFNKDPTDELKTVNMYELLGEPLQNLTLNNINNIIENADDNAGDNDDDTDAGDWKTVVNKNGPGKRHRRIVNQRQDCPYGLRCKKKDECGYRHTAEERQLFRQNPGQNLRLWKTQLCRYAPNCYRGRECHYAHTESEARCLDCEQTGHFQGDTAKCLLRA